jgi:hypothetical protein
MAFNNDCKSVIPHDIPDRVLADTLAWSEACSGPFEYDNADLPLADTMSNVGQEADGQLLYDKASWLPSGCGPAIEIDITFMP